MRIFALAILATALLSAQPSSAAWHETQSPHFTIYADEDPAELKQFAQTLERFNAAVREARGLPEVDAGASSRVTLYVLKDVAAIQRLYGGEGVAGFYIPLASGSVSFVPKKSKGGKWGLKSDTIFLHEYVHHLMLGNNDRPWPAWVSEGSAEFFATAKFNPDGSVVIGEPPLYREDALTPRGTLPLTKMVSGDFTYLTSLEYESIYGRGWMLVHYLAFEPSRRGQLTRYLNDISAGIPALRAATNAFGDLRTLERDLNAYHGRNRFPLTTIAADRLRIPPVSVRAVSPGESELMDAQIKLARGGKNLGAATLAPRAAAVAARYPNDLRVNILTSRLHFAADKPEEALAAADRALALDSASYDALLARAQARLSLAKSDPKASDWTAVRAAILAANKADLEAADPLILYYRSFVHQGLAPTDNAIDGLRYALALAPQDDLLRMEVVGHLIDADRIDAARAAIMPLVNNPHRGKRRESAVAIDEALKAKDRKLAREKWAEAQRHYRQD